MNKVRVKEKRINVRGRGGSMIYIILEEGQ
jgi:hypothetical protein